MQWWQSLIISVLTGAVTAFVAMVNVRQTNKTTMDNVEKTNRVTLQSVERTNSATSQSVAKTTATTKEVADKTNRVAKENARIAASFNREATTQRENAAKREEWWRRFVWAAELTMRTSELDQERGLQVLISLRRSSLAGRDEELLMYAFAAPGNESVLRRLEEGVGSDVQ